MVEYVERLGPEFKSHALFDGEALVQRHIEVRPARIPKNVAPGIPEGETDRCRKRGRVVPQGAETKAGSPCETGGWIPYQIGTGTGTDARSHSSIFPGLQECEWGSRRNAHNPRILPASQQRVPKPLTPEERKIPNIAQVEDMALIEIRTRPVCREIVRIHQAGIAAIGRIVDG